MRLASLVNQYLSEQAPWALLEVRPRARRDVLYVALRAIDNLKTLFDAVPAVHLARRCTSCSATTATSPARSSSARSTRTTATSTPC